ncbi:MAG: manganese efflux pump [Planctomycetes bacterium]|nr:manganese efflux pump [Planctomycetota bacterium]
MDILTTLIIALGLATDCFTVSITSGIIIRNLKVRHAVKISLFFGLFQAVMPCVGWLAGVGMKNLITGFDHWIAFGLLVLVGGKMIYESFKIEGEKKESDPLNIYVLLTLSIATSIDALAIGVTLAFLDTVIILPVIIIGAITFIVSFIGIYAGNQFGHIFGSKIEAVGGLVLIAIGVKILVNHL